MMGKMKGNFLAPDAVIMFGVALLLDAGGIICFILDLTYVGAAIGIPLSTALDILGLFTFSAWILFVRSGNTGGLTKGRTGRVLKKLLKYVGVPTFIESIPIVGDVAFSWVVAVYLEVKNG